MQKTEPIRENYIYRGLYKNGKSVVTPFFVLYYRPNRKSVNRLGLTASKTVGNAVKRNRSRRVLREAYRLLEPTLCSGFDLVLVARTRTATVPMPRVKDQLEAVFVRERIWMG